jgi:hypothetical protein
VLARMPTPKLVVAATRQLVSRAQSSLGSLWSRAGLEQHGWRRLLVCVGIGVALCLPGVGSERVLDDAILEHAMRGPPLRGLADGVVGMFTFASGDPAQNRELIERGVLLPWWADQELRVAFFRPLSALSHALDFLCWPEAVRAMYLHSLLWLGLAIAAATRLYRQLEPEKPVAAGAALLFAMDPAHAGAACWLSSRNTLIATFFGVCAISSWVQGRRALSTLLIAASLLSSEAGVGAVAYLGCYTWLLDRRPLRVRILDLMPVVLVTVTWRALHVVFGFGASGSGAYIDPVPDLHAWSAVLPERLTASFGAGLGLIPADLSFVARPEHARVLLALALLTVLLFALVVYDCIRTDPVARFWAAGSVLAALPLTAAPPNDRGLLLVTLGLKALVVRVVVARAGSGTSDRLARTRSVIGMGFLAWHALAAPLMLALRAGQFQAFGRVTAGTDAALDAIPDLPHRTVVVMNPPLDLFASYVQPRRAVRGVAMAGHFYWLASPTSKLSVTRVAPDTLEVTRAGGLCSTALERLYRRDPTSLRPGTSVELDALRVEIVASAADGKPATARFHFRAPLEDESLVFLAWRAGTYARVAPPGLGQTRTFEQESLWPRATGVNSAALASPRQDSHEIGSR